MREDWEAKAVEFGYPSYEKLLLDLYVSDGLTMKQIAQKMGCSIFTLSKHLDDFNIPKRRPGGVQNLAFKKWRLFRLDQRVVYSTPDTELEKLLTIDKSTVYKYKREFRRGRV